MTIAKSNVVAKIAAIVAGLGLVAMAFAPAAKADTTSDLQAQIASLLAQIAALQGQLGGSQTSASMMFNTDLTIGSTGADVTALQNWLISKGFAISAGATGYFGAQTQAALASYQAANGISPAAGYFGPVTRAKVNASAGTSTGTGTGTGTGTSTGGLSGGEADLSNFDLISGDDLAEGDSNSEIAVAKFDVDNGDVRVQRVTVDLQPTSSTPNEHPWSYIDSLSVYNGSTKVGSVDAGSKSDWDQNNDDTSHSGTLDYYTIDIPVDTIVREGDKAELSIRADAQSTIDSEDQDQTFNLQIPEQGIRAVDAAGIQQYVGNDGEEVTLGFNGANNGDLTVRKASDNPDAGVLVADDTNTSDDFDVLKFEIKNSDDGDADINSVTVDVATSSAATTTGAASIKNIIRRATLTIDGNDYDGTINSDKTIDFDNIDDLTVNGNDTVDGVLTVSLFGQNNHFAASGEGLTFSIAGSKIDAEGTDTGDSTDVTGTAQGETQSISSNAGISVSGGTMSASETYNSTTVSSSTGNFTLKFDVTANGDDVYVPATVASTSATGAATAGIVVDPTVSGNDPGAAVTASVSSSADKDNGYYIVHDGDTETFTVSVSIDPTTTNFYQVGIDAIHYNTSESTTGLSTLDVDQRTMDQTDPLNIHS